MTSAPSHQPAPLGHCLRLSLPWRHHPARGLHPAGPLQRVASRLLTGSRLLAALALGLVLLAATWSRGADAPAPSRFDDQPIHHDSPAAPDSGATVPPAPSGNPAGLDLTRIALSLGSILGLIFSLRWIARRIFPAATRGVAGNAVQLISRSTIGPRQHVLLIHVGNRLIVVGETASQLTALAEIADPNEVASILGQSSRPGVSRGSFDAIFGSARKVFSKIESDEEGEPAVTESDVEALDAVNRDIAPSPSTVPPAPSAPPATIDQAQQELSGLSQRIRHLSRELGKG